MAKKRIAVLFGGDVGDSSGLDSAFSVLNGLSRSIYEVIPIGITKAGRWLYFPGDYSAILDGSWESDPDCCSAVLSPDPLHGGLIKIIDEDNHSLQRIDVIFPVLRGKYGECGQIQALCKLSSIAYVGSGFSAAGACYDRSLTYLILNKAGIKTAKYCCLERVELDGLNSGEGGRLADIEAELGYPMYIKSAVGDHRGDSENRAENRDELKHLIKRTFSQHHKILIEEAIAGDCLECIVWGSIYSLNVSENVSTELAELAKTAFIALGCVGFAQISFTITERGEFFCCGATTLPDLTEGGLMSRLIEEEAGYSRMLDMLIDSSQEI